MSHPKEIIANAIHEGRSSLNEYSSKQLLEFFNIPFPQGKITKRVEEAASVAMSIGFPVAMKVLGDELSHKTEVGGIALNLRSEEEVEREGERLLQIPHAQGLLVQEQILGNRELVCGLVRKDKFGPCVMFGLGGVLTEAVSDVVFRIAPLEVKDTYSMMEQLRSAKVLEEFRGESAVNRESLSKILLSLSAIGIEYEEVVEIDINPLMIQPDGRPIAVDALVILKQTIHN